MTLAIPTLAYGDQSPLEHCYRHISPSVAVGLHRLSTFKNGESKIVVACLTYEYSGIPQLLSPNTGGREGMGNYDPTA